MLTIAWLGTSILAPSLLARRALRRGQEAFVRRQFKAAERHLERAARHPSLREEATCLLAEAHLYQRQASEALYLLNTFVLEQDRESHARTSTRSPRIRLLRAVAGCMLGRPSAARRELAAIPRGEASVDTLLALAQACIMANDVNGTQQLLELLQGETLEPALHARVHLCRAALYFRLQAWEKCLLALPDPADCTPQDAIVAERVRQVVEQRLARAAV